MPRTVHLMLTCLCDALYGRVGVATVKVLEHVGCEVKFDERQTCCGQPPFNAGDWDAARKIARHAQSVLFASPQTVVTPSGSCAAMVREGYPLLFPDEKHHMAFELSEFLVKELGMTEWPATKSYPANVAIHRACHGRGIRLKGEVETLIRTIPGIEICHFLQPEQCCGFGGAFSALQGNLTEGIGMTKLEQIIKSGAELVVSSDMGCLMHLDGLIRRHDFPLKVIHFAEILAEVVD